MTFSVSSRWHVLVRMPFLSKTEKYSVEITYYILLIHSSISELLCYFQDLVIVNNDAMNINIKIFVWVHVFNYLEYIPRSRIVDHMVTVSTFFFTNSHTVFNSACTILSFQCIVRGFWFLHILANMLFYGKKIFFDYSYPHGCERASHCGFDLHFPNDPWCWGSFYLLIAHLYILLEKVSIQAALCLIF